MWRIVEVLIIFILFKNFHVLGRSSLSITKTVELAKNNFDDEIMKNNYFVLFYTSE